MQWVDVLTDKTLENLPYKIKLNEWGNVEMLPLSNKRSYIKSEIFSLLNDKLPYGKVLFNLPIQIENQVRVPDVVWCSKIFLKQHIKEDTCSVAPEICIEVISPSNNFAEMKRKMALYFKAGAKEVWLVDFKGKARIFNEINEIERLAFDIDVVLDLDW